VLVRDDATNGAAHFDHAHNTTNGANQYDHARVRELLSDYLDGSLSPPEHERVHRHLDGCDACRAFRNTLGKLVDVVGQFPNPHLGREGKQRILNQMREESSTPS